MLGDVFRAILSGSIKENRQQGPTSADSMFSLKPDRCELTQCTRNLHSACHVPRLTRLTKSPSRRQVISSYCSNICNSATCTTTRHEENERKKEKTYHQRSARQSEFQKTVSSSPWRALTCRFHTLNGSTYSTDSTSEVRGLPRTSIDVVVV